MSFFREPFRDFVKNALTNRVNLLKEGTKGTSRSTNWYTQYVNKAAFLRVAPMVLITDENILNGKDPLEFTKNYVLEGAPLLYDGEKFKKGPQFPGELSKTNTNSLLNNPNIRTNAQDGFGIVPPPGVTSFSIDTKSFYGNLREAKLSIRCFNLNQFEIIEKLYSRPGHHVMVEWGWSHYLDDKGQPQKVKDLITNPNKEEFWGNKKEGFIEPGPLYKLIDSQKEFYKGCYDGFLGIIKNFTTKIEKDGGFTLDIQLIGRGSLINSIPIDRADSPTNINVINTLYKERDISPERVKNLFTDPKSGTNLTNILTYLNHKFSNSKENPLDDSEPVTGVDTLEVPDGTRYVRLGYLFMLLNKFAISRDNDIPIVGINNTLLNNSNKQYLSNYPEFPAEKLDLFNFREYLKVDQEFDNTTKKGILDKVNNFIKSLPEVVKDKASSRDPKNLFNFVKDQPLSQSILDLSIITSYIGSFNPKKVIFPHQFNINDYSIDIRVPSPNKPITIGQAEAVFESQSNFNQGIDNLLTDIKPYKTYIETTYTERGQDIYDYLNQVSLNQTTLFSDIDNEVAQFTNRKRTINNIFYSIDDLLEYLKEKTQPSLDDLLSHITNTINKVSGNSLNLKVIDNPIYPYYVSIVNFNPKPKVFKPEDYFKFPKIGIQSLYKDLTITSKIPDAQASSIAIAAVGSKDVDNIETFTYDAFLRGVQTRIKPSSNIELKDYDLVKISNGLVELETTRKFFNHLNSLKANQTKPFKEITSLNGNSTLSNLISDIMGGLYIIHLTYFLIKQTNSLKTLQPIINNLPTVGSKLNKDIIKYKSVTGYSKLPFTAFLPLNVSITMEGISGILASNTFKLEEGMLPEQYNQERVSYVVTKEQQTIKGLTWETSLEGKIVLDDSDPLKE